MTPLRSLVGLAGVALALSLGSVCAEPAVRAEPAECDLPPTLRFAQIPLQDKARGAEPSPLVPYLEEALGMPVRQTLVHSYGAVIEGLLAGRIDVADLGPAALAEALARGARLDVLAAFSGQEGILFDTSAGYQSVLIVAHDQPAESLADLRHASLGLTDPASTSGNLIPQNAVMEGLGTSLAEHFGQVFYLGSHHRAIQAVVERRVDAAFVSSTQVDQAIRRKTLEAEAIRVLWQSATIPLDPHVARTELCDPLRERVRQALLQANDSLRPWFDSMGRTGFRAVQTEDYAMVLELYAGSAGAGPQATVPAP